MRAMKKFILEYFDKIKQLLDLVDIDEIENIALIIRNAAEQNAKIYVIGNGGSASTAAHFVNDLGVGLKGRGILNLDIISLCENVAVTTAIANDYGYENIYFYQLKEIIRENDVIFALSCSGNSENIIKAVTYAKECGALIVGVTGFDGGQLKKICDVNFHVPTEKGEYGLVEDLHMILDHILFSYFIIKGKNHE